MDLEKLMLKQAHNFLLMANKAQTKYKGITNRNENIVMQDYNCPLCDGLTEESLIHLFIHCPFAIHCWAWINIQIDYTLDLSQVLQSFKEQL